MDKKDRLLSLDALRGADMCFIMGLAALITAVCRWCGAGEGWLARQMNHVGWEGLAQHDTIFPTFLFIAGVSWPFSHAAQVAKGATTMQIVLRVLKRGALLVLLGLVYNGLLRGDWAHLRLPGVLQFIGLSWMFAALLYVFIRKVPVRIGITAVLLLGYWALLAFVGAPDAPEGAGPFSYEGNLSGWIDRTFLAGHTLGRCDPEGFLSILSGTCTAMFGVYAGEIVRGARPDAHKVLALVGLAGGLLALGFAGQPWCPCIKKLWTPTFALFAGAYSAFFFALFFWICDVLKFRRWAFFFRVVGVNAITIYLGQRIIDFHHANAFFFGGLANQLPKEAGAVLLGATYILCCWAFLWFLDRKQVYLKV